MTTYSSTFATVKSEVADKARMNVTDEATRLGEWVNQALVNVASQSRYFSGSATGAALAAAATSQALDSTLVDLEYVTCSYGGQVTNLRAVTFAQILMLRANTSTGPPTVYSLRKGTIELWPGAAGGEILTQYGATLPTILTGTDATPLPEPFGSKLLVYGAMVEAADFKKDPNLLYFYQPMFDRWMAQFQAYLNMRVTQGGRSFPVYGPNGLPFDSQYVPHDPSTDLYGWR